MDVTVKRVKRLGWALATCVLLTLTTTATGQPPTLPSILPADADLVVLVKDVPGLVKTWNENPFGALWSDPDMQGFLATVREQLKIDHWEEVVQAETGYTLSEILAQFTGQLAFVMPDLPAWDAPDEETAVAEENEEGQEDEDDFMGPWAIMADVGSDTEILEALLAKDFTEQMDDAEEDEEIQEIEEEFQGETLHLRQTVTADEISAGEGWAIVDGTAIMAYPPETLRRLVAARKQGPRGGSLAEASGFQKIKRYVSDYDILAHLNFARLSRYLQEQAGEEAAKGEQTPVPMDRVVNALALDNLESAFLTSHYTPARSRADLGIFYAENTGIVKLLTYLPGPCPRPTFLPADLMMAGVARFSASQLIANLKELIGNVDPSLGAMVEMQLQQLTTQLGVDIEKDIFGSMGEVLFGSMSPGPSGPTRPEDVAQSFDQVMGISLKDRPTFERSLSQLLAAIGGGAELFTLQDYLGTTIHTFKPPVPSDTEGAAPTQIAYAIVQDYFLLSVGSGNSLRSILAAMHNPGPSIWSRPEVAAALEEVPGNASGVMYYDMARFMDYMFDTMVTAMESSGAAEEMWKPEYRPGLKKLTAFFGPMVGWYQKDDHSFRQTMLMKHPEQ
jgi:hypothetical protein